MERETKRHALPSGLAVTLHTYLTASEHNAIKSLMMSAMKIDIADLKSGATEVPLKGQIDGTILMEQEKLLVKYLVKESPTPVDSLRASDYESLVSELNSIKAGNLPKVN